MKSFFLTLFLLSGTANSATISYRDAVAAVQLCLIEGAGNSNSFFETLQMNLTGKKTISYEASYPFDVYQDQVRDFKRILYRGKASDSLTVSSFEGFTTGSTKLHFLFVDRSHPEPETTYMETDRKFPILNFKKMSALSYDIFGNIIDARLEGVYIDSASENELKIVNSATKLSIRSSLGNPLSINVNPYIQCLKEKLNLP